VFKPCKTISKNGKTQRLESPVYWARYRDSNGKRRCHGLRLPNGSKVTDKTVAEKLLRDIVQNVERRSAGLIDRGVESAAMPIRIALADYVRTIRGRGRCYRYVQHVCRSSKRLFELAGIERLAQFTAANIERGIATLARQTFKERKAGPVAFTLSPKMLNEYRAAAFGFGQWATVTAELIDSNPVTKVSRREVRGDIRKVRRALTIDEAYRLLGVCGPRRLFYAVQLWSGLRVAETKALAWLDIDLDGDRPCIRLRAATTKAKRGDVLPLHRDLAKMLAAARGDDDTPGRVFATVPKLDTFKKDLGRAGIDVGDAQGRTVDRHACRTTFVSMLAACGVSDSGQRALARHADVSVTGRYRDARLLDLWADVNQLPPIRWTEPQTEALRATGTDGKKVVPKSAQLNGRSGPKLAQAVHIPNRVTVPCHTDLSLQNKGKTAILTCNQRSATDAKRARAAGSNPVAPNHRKSCCRRELRVYPCEARRGFNQAESYTGYTIPFGRLNRESQICIIESCPQVSKAASAEALGPGVRRDQGPTHLPWSLRHRRKPRSVPAHPQW
jgi:integrase